LITLYRPFSYPTTTARYSIQLLLLLVLLPLLLPPLLKVRTTPRARKRASSETCVI
jgi:hypothetical protein